eukprot:6655052-Prymnesium_polylepis.1
MGAVGRSPPTRPLASGFAAMPSKAVALVTGSSSGVGKAFALQLYERGYHVTISGRDGARCKAAADEINSNAVTKA